MDFWRALVVQTDYVYCTKRKEMFVTALTRFFIFQRKNLTFFIFSTGEKLNSKQNCKLTFPRKTNLVCNPRVNFFDHFIPIRLSLAVAIRLLDATGLHKHIFSSCFLYSLRLFFSIQRLGNWMNKNEKLETSSINLDFTVKKKTIFLSFPTF